jgi:tripartite-type tricarboxylate transporter receptor subunit TctC
MEKPMSMTFTWLHRSAAVALACAILSFAAPSETQAQSWPSRTIQAVIPFAAGNANDVVARIVLEQLSKELGQTIVIDNRPGAGGTTGIASAAKAAPDGHTMLVHSSSFAAAYSLYKSLPYDTFNDFVAVVPAGVQPMVLVAATSKGWKTLADLIAAAKARPGELNYASAGVGAASHLAAERFRVGAGITAQHIPFKGPVEALTEVITGRIDYYFLPLAAALPLINDGKLVAFAVSTPERARSLPNVPTTAESGLKDSSYSFWTGIFLPAKTPAEIVKRLHDETEKAVRETSVAERLAKVGVQPMAMGVAEFGAFFRDDVLSTAKLMKDIGVQPVE